MILIDRSTLHDLQVLKGDAVFLCSIVHLLGRPVLLMTCSYQWYINRLQFKGVYHSLDFLRVLYFFPGWLCHFKGLFIPVWREIHRSKILPVTSWQFTNRTVSSISFSSRHSTNRTAYLANHDFFANGTIGVGILTNRIIWTHVKIDLLDFLRKITREATVK